MISFIVVYVVLATWAALIIGFIAYGFKMAMTPVSSLPPGFDLQREAERVAAQSWKEYERYE